MLTGIINFIVTNMINVFIAEVRSSGYPMHPLPNQALCKTFLTTLSYIVRVKRFYNEMLAFRSVLLLDVCMLILSPNASMPIKSARDFIGAKEDIFNHQNLDLVENSAGKLIEAYIDRIDGSVILLCNVMINLINFQLTANPNFINSLPQDFV